MALAWDLGLCWEIMAGAYEGLSSLSPGHGFLQNREAGQMGRGCLRGQKCQDEYHCLAPVPVLAP